MGAYPLCPHPCAPYDTTDGILSRSLWDLLSPSLSKIPIALAVRSVDRSLDLRWSARHKLFSPPRITPIRGLVPAVVSWVSLRSTQPTHRRPRPTRPHPRLKPPRCHRGRVEYRPRAPITRQDMRRLIHLSTYDRGIIDLSGLETATNVEYLALGQNALGELSPLAHLPNLRGLVLPDYQINDISSLSSLTRLEELNVRRNPISDLSPLAHLNTLKYLDLSKCLIVDIAPFSHLVNLKVLQLNHNQIVDVRPLASLVSLYKLEIHHNLILDHSPLDSLSLDIFRYDQTCEMPPLPLEPRLENRNYPSIAARWSGYGWPPVRYRPNLSDAENIALHDL